VANDRKWSRTMAIKVYFPFDFLVVFDLMYFRFRPSKAKSIGNVLTNRQNAAELKKSAEESRMRQYIDATTHLASIGNGVQICSVYNFKILFRGLFFSSPRIAYCCRMIRCVNRQCALQKRKKICT
jgi:hypothetical protein